MTFVRGSIVWVELGPGEGSEQRKRRPALVVSNDGANRAAQALGQGVITLVPLTTSSRLPLPFQVSIPSALSSLPADSVAQVEQVRSVDVTRVSATRWRLPANVMEDIAHALRVHLALW